MKIALIGDGAMGRLIRLIAEKRNHQIVVTIDESDAALDDAALAMKLRGVDAAIDFTVAAAVERNVRACMLAGVPLVEGTTGWNDKLASIRSVVAELNGAFVYGANFSVGVNLFYRVVDAAAALFSRFDEYEAFVEERHHSRKKDAPSGTALKLREIVAAHYPNEFSVAATRAGHIPGTHIVGFDGEPDTIELIHTARSREGFAKGAVLAAEWIVGRTGFYEFPQVMDDILGSEE